MKLAHIFLTISLSLPITTYSLPPNNPLQAHSVSLGKMVAIGSAAWITAVAVIALSAKWYKDSRKCSAFENYEKAILGMKQVIADPFAGDLALNGTIISQKHLDHYHELSKTKIAWHTLTESLDLLFNNARAKNGKQYYPNLDQHVTELIPTYRDAYTTFIHTYDVIKNHLVDFEVLTHQKSTLHNINEQIEQLQSTPDVFAKLSEKYVDLVWLLDAQRDVMILKNHAIQTATLVTEHLDHLTTYHFEGSLEEECKKLVATTQNGIHFLSALIEQIKQHPHFIVHQKIKAERDHYEEKISNLKKTIRDLERELAVTRINASIV